MGQYATFSDQGSLEEQVKTLDNRELLDLWQETQQLAKLLDQEEQTDIEYNPEYERVILQELQYRTCRKGQS